MRFTQFREENDWEGENWNFWLQVDGNLEELAKLEKLINDYEEVNETESPYRLTGEVVDEREVELLVHFAEDGYMASHNKVPGRFTCPVVTDLADWERFENLFYKGGIEDFFEEE